MMSLTAGQRLDLGIVYHINENNQHTNVKISDLFAGKRIVVFLGPAPFSKLDTDQAVSYEILSDQILKENIDEIIGIYVQDAFVMDKFQEFVRQQSTSKNVKFYGDGDGFFVKASNLMHDFTFEGLSTRCGRWAIVLNDSQIEYVVVDDYSVIDITSAENILKYLKNEA